MDPNTAVRSRAVALAVVVLAAVAVAAGSGVPAGIPSAQAQAGSAEAAKLLQTAINAQTVDGKLEEAIALYQRIVSTYPNERAIAATALVRMAQCHEQLGRQTAQGLYERVVREYPEQQDAAAQARARLAALGANNTGASPAPASGAVLRQLWSEELNIDYGEISPDGTRFSGVDAETGDLVVVDVATRRITRLTNTPKEKAWDDFAEFPVWSPDGKRLAYLWYTDSRSARAVGLRITDISTGSTRSVTLPSALRPCYVFDWSPDGSEVLAAICRSGRSPASELNLGWIAVADGQFREIATVSSAGLLSAFASHNSGDVAYSRVVHPTFEIGFVSHDGRQRSTILKGTGDYEVIGWTPTDDGLVLMDGRYGSARLWILRHRDGVAAGEPALLREVPGCGPAGMTSGGSLFHSVSARGRADVFLAPYDPEGHLVGTERKRFNSTSDGWNVTGPAWSPDGRQLAWVTRSMSSSVGTAGSLSKVTVKSVATGADRTIALPFQPYVAGPVLGWTADGSRIFVMSGGNQGLHAVDVASGEVSEVVPSSLTRAFEAGQDSVVVGGWSHDGRSAYMMVTARSDSAPMRMRTVRLVERGILDGREQVLWTNAAEVYASFPRLSPDGRWIAVQLSRRDREGNRPSVGVIPAVGGSLRELAGLAGTSVSHAWTPDSRGLLVRFMPAGGGPREALFVPLDGAPPRPVGLSSTGLLGFAVSPDGSRIAYTEGQPGRYEGVWTLDNFLPPAPPVKAK